MARRRRTQLGAVTGRPYEPYQFEQVEARRALLPQMMEVEQQRELQQAQIRQMREESALARERFGLEEEELALRRRAERAGMGLEAAKFGYGLLGEYGDVTAGDVAGRVGGAVGLTPAAPGAATAFRMEEAQRAGLPFAPDEGFFGKVGQTLGQIPLGLGIGTGLMGFGVGQLAADKSRAKRGLLGGLAGGVTGLLSGGGLAGGLTGLAFGGLGGMLG